ncbi:hypothetical protein BCR44DRAFT_127899 [Catenaria anguillulae PL171]|uniref:Protoporphyrinogen oxidase n=1 Tax=Catenaria anguillulae PL171 TaxID=765915 RepID=A0A1Y2HKH9_9FUNG|nr:hypothetical protein BCR44DRAFT_127899 [Catenaria anguillulae PL171]
MQLTRLALAASIAGSGQSRHIAVLGGGISGLATAHFVRRRLADRTGTSGASDPIRITLIDKAPRLGGWIQSDVDRATGVLLEAGPRTLRPKGLPGALTLAMIHDLGLADQVVTVPMSSPSAKVRQMLFQDRVERLPVSLGEVIKTSRDANSPMAGIVPAAVREVFVPRRPSQSGAQGRKDEDETIAAFLSRRFSPALVNNLVSGIVHGIYAGNPHQLSVRATFPSLWNAERDHRSVVLGVLKGAMSAMSPADAAALAELVQSRGPKFADLWAGASKASIYSVRGGLEAIVGGLEAALMDHVEFNLGSQPTSIRLPTDPARSTIEVTLANGSTIRADHLVSTIPTPSLNSLLSASGSSASPALTHLASTGKRTHPHLLGIIFDSAAVPGLAEPEYTKFTVMMGGHYFSQPGVHVPSVVEAGELALDAVRRHLSIPEWVATPVVVRARLHHECIPQYGVGHVQAVRRARDEVGARRVELVGAWYDGVGVNDCVRSAWEAAQRIAG